MNSVAEYLPTSWTLWILATFNKMLHAMLYIGKYVDRIRRAIGRIFYDDLWYGLEGYPVLFDSDKFQVYPSGSARVEWVYAPDSNTFYEWAGSEKGSLLSPRLPHPLPLLSMELLEGQGTDVTVAYDLTDFLETMRVVNATAERKAPTLSQILGAWRIASGIVPDLDRFRMRVMNDAAETAEVDLFSICSIAEVFGSDTTATTATDGTGGTNSMETVD